MVEKISKWLYKIIFAVCVLLGIAMIIIGFMQVFWRYFLQQPLSWSEEILRYLYVWSIFLGISIAIPENGHVAVDALMNLLKGLPKKILSVFIHLVILIFFGLMLTIGSQYTLVNIHQMTPSTRISLGVVYISIPLGGLFGLWFTAVELSKFFRRREETQ